MNADFVVFPKPSKPSYSWSNPNLIWIPRTQEGSKGQGQLFTPSPSRLIDRIPCMFYSCNTSTDKLIVYFHANSEDIGNCDYFFYPLKDSWRCHVLVVEYPRYGLYKDGPELNEESIKEDAEIVYNFLLESIGLDEKQIILFGRSLGSGPATHLASKHNPLMLLLFTPFKSIKQVAESLTTRFLAMLLKDRFRNIDIIHKVRSPCLLIHGERDRLVPCTHSEDLFSSLTSPKSLHLSPSMTHNDYDVFTDLIQPFNEFISREGLDSQTNQYIDIEVIYRCRYNQY